MHSSKFANISPQLHVWEHRVTGQWVVALRVVRRGGVTQRFVPIDRGGIPVRPEAEHSLPRSEFLDSHVRVPVIVTRRKGSGPNSVRYVQIGQ